MLADAAYKQKVLDRTPMRRVGEPIEVSGACLHVRTSPCARMGHASDAAEPDAGVNDDQNLTHKLCMISWLMRFRAGVVAFLCSPAASYVPGQVGGRETSCLTAAEKFRSACACSL